MEWADARAVFRKMNSLSELQLAIDDPEVWADGRRCKL